MEPKDYIVSRIEGEYAYLTDIKNGNEVFIAMALLVLLLALPFRSMIVEAVTASTETIEDVREGDVIFQTSQSR